MVRLTCYCSHDVFDIMILYSILCAFNAHDIQAIDLVYKKYRGKLLLGVHGTATTTKMRIEENNSNPVDYRRRSTYLPS